MSKFNVVRRTFSRAGRSARLQMSRRASRNYGGSRRSSYTRPLIKRKTRVGSRTTKKKLSNGVSLEAGGHGTKSYFRYTVNKLPRNIMKLGKFLGRQTYYQNAAGAITVSNPGYQTVFGGGAGGSGATGNGTMLWTYTQYDLNEIWDTRPGTTYATSKVKLHRCRAQTMFSNVSNVTGNLYIYDIIARRDLPLNVTGSGSQDCGPQQAWQRGMVDQGLSSGSDWTIRLGMTPFNSPKFCELYKILKVTHVVIGAGCVHSHTVEHEQNRLWSMETLNNIYDPSNDLVPMAFAGLSHAQLWVLSGFPNADTDDSYSSTSAAKLVYTYTKQFEFEWLEDNTSQLAVVADNLAHTYAGTEKVIVEATGAETTVTKI